MAAEKAVRQCRLSVQVDYDRGSADKTPSICWAQVMGRRAQRQQPAVIVKMSGVVDMSRLGRIWQRKGTQSGRDCRSNCGEGTVLDMNRWSRGAPDKARMRQNWDMT